MKATLSVSMDLELANRVAKFAKVCQKTRSQVVALAIERFFDQRPDSPKNSIPETSSTQTTEAKN